MLPFKKKKRNSPFPKCHLLSEAYLASSNQGVVIHTLSPLDRQSLRDWGSLLCFLVGVEPPTDERGSPLALQLAQPVLLIGWKSAAQPCQPQEAGSEQSQT